MLAFSIDYYGIFFRATQSVELFCTYIITANATGEKYLIKAKSIQDILDDWNGDCEFVPSNDACVFYTEWNGRPINPAGYTDFGTLIEYLKGLQKRGSGV